LKFFLDQRVNTWRFSVNSAKDMQEKLLKIVPSPVDFILPHRLYLALTSLATLKQPQAISGLLADQSNADEAQVDDSYNFITMLLYVIPVLGFIGTVLGLGAAIGNFGSTLTQVGGANLDAMIPSLQGVTGGLALAFDTTLLALIAALILQIYASFVRSMETSFLEDCNLFFQQEVLPKLSEQDEEGQ
jgi:biopolymer transport protein ExbB/TolQ